MPQMAPLAWSSLMLLFVFLLIMIMIFMFFFSPVSLPQKNSSPSMKSTKTHQTWSW